MARKYYQLISKLYRLSKSIFINYILHSKTQYVFKNKVVLFVYSKTHLSELKMQVIKDED